MWAAVYSGMVSRIFLKWYKLDAYLDIHREMTTRMDSRLFQLNQNTGVVVLDLTAAYDTVWHLGLYSEALQNSSTLDCRLSSSVS